MTMKRTALLGILVATIVIGPAYGEPVPEPAGASPSWGRSVPDFRHDGMIGWNVDPKVADETYRNALVAADCILALGDRAGRALAEGGEGLAIGGEIYTRYRACARQPNAALRLVIDGAVAERLLAAEAVAPGPPRAPHVDVDDATRFHGDLAMEHVSLTSVARCAAVYSPGLALEVLHSKVGSDSEEESLAALFAQTPECGLASPPATIPAPVQRSAVAVALYRWRHRSA